MTALLDLGLGPNHQNNEGRTALTSAATKGRNEIVKLLGACGAPLDIKDKDSGDTDKVGSSGAGLSIGVVALCDGTAGAAR